MEIKKYLVVVLMLMFAISLTTALRFSPGVHRINTQVGEEVCKDLYFDVGSNDWSVIPLFAPDYSYRWSSRSMIVEPAENWINLSINLLEPRWGMNRVSVCYSFKSSGLYKGILFVQSNDQYGSYFVRGGIWIKAVVE